MTKDFRSNKKRCPRGTQFPEIDSRKSHRHTVYDKTAWPRPSTILLASGYRTYSNFEPCTYNVHVYTNIPRNERIQMYSTHSAI